MKLVFVGGAQGSGKSTLVAQAAMELRKKGFSILHLDPGERLRDYCKRHDLGSWAGMSAKGKLEVNRAVLKEIKPLLAQHDLVFVSTHYVASLNKLSKKSTRSLTDIPLKAPLSKPLARMASHLVLLDSDPEEIYRRVNSSDKARPREWQDVTRTVIANRLSATALAKERQLPLTVIHNRRDLERKAIGELVKIGRMLVKE